MAAFCVLSEAAWRNFQPVEWGALGVFIHAAHIKLLLGREFSTPRRGSLDNKKEAWG